MCLECFTAQTDAVHGDQLSGRPGNVAEFDNCQEIVREEIQSGKTVYC